MKWALRGADLFQADPDRYAEVEALIDDILAHHNVRPTEPAPEHPRRIVLSVLSDTIDA